MANDTLSRANRKRSRKIIWFNPPYSSNVTKCFLRLIDKNFPRGHQFHKLFNRNTIKLSYSCLPNVGSILASTRHQAQDETARKAKLCNCRKPEMCPLKEQCLKAAVIYEATVAVEKEKKEHKYIGLTENTFKTRFSSHTSSFKLEKKNQTELSKKIWELKDKH